MLSGYEKAYKEIIPAARAALIIELKKKYDIKEEAISKYVGITQAAISKYLNGRYSSRIKGIVEKLDKDIVASYAEKIASGNTAAMNKYMCTICNKLNGFDCKFSRAND